MKKFTCIGIITALFLCFLPFARAGSNTLKFVIENKSDSMIVYGIYKINNLDVFKKALERKKADIPDNNAEKVMEFWDKNQNLMTDLTGGYLQPGAVHDFDFENTKNYYVEIGYQNGEKGTINGVVIKVDDSIKKVTVIWKTPHSYSVSFE